MGARGRGKGVREEAEERAEERNEREAEACFTSPPKNPILEEKHFSSGFMMDLITDLKRRSPTRDPGAVNY